ncbi:MAG: hypothetical protein IT196_16690, partial [Acidimicrobiales bacterium]|nr:hypothetical protein [Acidimicrobiales bacterium]
CLETAALIRCGRLADAEVAAHEAFALGCEVGDADAFAFLGGHLVAIRYAQGRSEELLPLIEQVSGSADLMEMDHSFVAGVASAAATAGDRHTTARALDVLTAGGLDAIPRLSTWTATMLATVLAADALGRIDVLEQTARLLEPFRTLPVRPSLAVVCFGSLRWGLGRIALATGRLDDAVEELQAPVAATARLAHLPDAALARGELAEALQRRGAAGDRARAAAVLREAAEIAATAEMERRAAEWRDRAAQLDADEPDTAPMLVMRPEGRGWFLRYGQLGLHVPASVGLGYVAALVQRPGVEVRAIELTGAAATQVARQDLADDRALDQYRRQLRELRQVVEEAEDNADFERAAAARIELESLAGFVQPLLGINGRSRGFTSDEERARMAAQKAIRRAIDRVTLLCEPIGRHLSSSVRTGRYCCYEPVPSVASAPTDASADV